jgi:hypothetical protein
LREEIKEIEPCEIKLRTSLQYVQEVNSKMASKSADLKKEEVLIAKNNQEI